MSIFDPNQCTLVATDDEKTFQKSGEVMMPRAKQHAFILELG
jgi:hypothetical protein